ncbi:MAG TPA: FAD-binding oxidoreductase [Xanthobacteraceae bacterium]|jgi:FAD/FMN-containing dehydrogenase
MATGTVVEQFRRDIGNVASSIDERQLRMKSRDFYWYSPILTAQLQDRRADVAVQPRTEQEIGTVAAAAARHRIPLTVRGGGTGNYGQSVPLEGGIVLDMTRYDKVEEVKPGRIRVQAGALIHTALEAALATGQQLMMYPSTMKSATIGGYLGGGFAGIGSVRHGIIRDSGMIESLRIMTLEESPRILRLSGDDVGFVFHAWGTTGIILEAQLKLVPAEKWIDCIATFPAYADVIGFGNAAFDSGFDIFLLSAVERRFAPFYKRLEAYFDGSRDAMFSMVKDGDVDRFFALAARFNGQRAMAVSDTESAAANLRRIHETAFNHTTLMALQVERHWTYLQVVTPNPFEPKLAEEQMRRFGDEVLMHHEYTREKGRCRIGGLPLIRYTTERRLNEIMRSFESDGCVINNPHIFKLEDGGRFDPEGRKMAFRAEVDPLGLMNPGKLRSMT